MESLQIDEKYVSALKTFNLKVEDALSEFIILNLSRKIAEFKNECEMFEKKYEIDFETFEDRIMEKINEEDFEEEDDYLAWKFADESKSLLKKRLEEIL
jgi:hypothetical protein